MKLEAMLPKVATWTFAGAAIVACTAGTGDVPGGSSLGQADDPGSAFDEPGSSQYENPGGGGSAPSGGGVTFDAGRGVPDVHDFFDSNFDNNTYDYNVAEFYVPPRDTSPPVDANQCSQSGWYSPSCSTCMSTTSHCCAQFQACQNDFSTYGCRGYFQCIQGSSIDPLTGASQCRGLSTGTCATNCESYYSAGYNTWYALRTCQIQWCSGSCQ
jgi:hypothetical protein